MADDVTFQDANLSTPPDNTVIATDDAAGRHVQIFKLAEPTNGSATAWGTAATGLPVDVKNASIAVTGTLTTGGSQDDQTQASAGLTTATTAYTVGDVLGSGWTFTSMATGSGGHGKIVGISCLDVSDVMEGMLLYFSKSSITFGTDNAGASVSDADAANLVGGPVALSFTDIGVCRFGSLDSVAIPYVCAATSLFVYATTLSGNAVFAGGADSLKLQFHYSIVD